MTPKNKRAKKPAAKKPAAKRPAAKKPAAKKAAAKKRVAKTAAIKPARQPEKPIDPIAQFRYLADTPGFDAVAVAIFSTAVSAKATSNGIVVEFPNGERLFAAPPAKPAKYASWPAPFRAFVAKHERLDFPTDDNRGWLLGSGDFENAYLDDTELEDRDDVFAPISTGQDWWIYHPTKRNAHGEPALCFFSHEGTSIEPVEVGAGAQFLTNMANEIGMRDVLPSEPVVARSGGTTWWHEDNCLDDAERNRIELEGPPTTEQLAITRWLSVRELRSIADLPLHGLTNLASLSLYSEKGAKLGSLAGIEALTNLEEIDADDHEIRDLAPLRGLTKLKRLSLRTNKITDLSPLANLTALENLYASHNGVSDLAPLAGLAKLEVLWLEDNRVKDISVLGGCTALASLHLYGNKAVKGLVALKPLPRLRELPLYPNDAEIEAFFASADGKRRELAPTEFSAVRDRLRDAYSDLCDDLYGARDEPASQTAAIVERANQWLADYAKLEIESSPKQRQRIYTEPNLGISDVDQLREFLDAVPQLAK